MRIAFSGPQNSGKTTLIKSFLYTWNMYTTPEKTYRDLIVEKGYNHSSQTTPETQWDVLNFMVEQTQQYDKKSKVVFDRCPMDNLVYTLWAFEKGIEGFDKAFVDKCIHITKESMRNLDLIFLTRYDPSIPIEDDGMRDVDKEYIQEIDNLFYAMRLQYENNYEADVFFPKDDSPCIIELPTNMQRRVDMISEYIDSDGNIFGEEHSILNPNKLDELEALVKQQKAALEQEEKEKELYRKFVIGDIK